MNWTKNDLERLKLKNNLGKNGNKPTKVEKISVEKESIKKALWVMKHEGLIPGYIEEHKFHPVRRYRFDWAIPQLMIAVEYEGIFSKKSGHTTISGYTKDCDKYNLAAIEGWRILRYTAKNYQDFPTDLKNLLI